MPRTEEQKIRDEILRKIRDKTPEGKMKCKINKWKGRSRLQNPNHKGLICDSREEYEYIYWYWFYSERCEECNKEYTIKNWKCMDHCHDTGLFRNILCNSCNLNLKSNNTSKIPNISWHIQSNGWLYRREIKGKIYRKYYKDLEWLKNYKKEFELKYYYIH